MTVGTAAELDNCSSYVGTSTSAARGGIATLHERTLPPENGCNPEVVQTAVIAATSTNPAQRICPRDSVRPPKIRFIIAKAVLSLPCSGELEAVDVIVVWSVCWFDQLLCALIWLELSEDSLRLAAIETPE
jgi:hypothetical protein